MFGHHDGIMDAASRIFGALRVFVLHWHIPTKPILARLTAMMNITQDLFVYTWSLRLPQSCMTLSQAV